MDPLATVEVTDEGVEVHSSTPSTREAGDLVKIAPLTGLLNIPNPSSREISQLETIYSYLEEDATSVGELLYQFKQLESKMGLPKLGETRLSKTYNWVKTALAIKDLEKQRDAM
jgi:hypothetical protein